MKSFLVVLGLLATASLGLAEYCDLCGDHTMCKYNGVGPSCGRASDSGVSPSEAQEIVKIHNALRSKVAKGEEQRGAPGPQPAAADMNAFVWDDKLAEVAQRWADQCTFQHDKCRDDPRFKVGQNIYWSSGLSEADWQRAITAWYNEVSKFNNQTTKAFEFSEATGHYTQLIWGKTKYIGCGRTTYGGAYRALGYEPLEYILSPIPSGSNFTQQPQKVKRQVNGGFFGGARFDPNGAAGSLGKNTMASGYFNQGSPINSGFFGGANFDSNSAAGSLGKNTASSGFNNFRGQSNGGFFGGAQFDSNGAAGSLGKNTASSGFNNFRGQTNSGFFGGAQFDSNGAAGSLGKNTASSGFNNFRGQTNSGFFGGAQFDPNGATGSLGKNTGSSGFNNFRGQSNIGFFGGAQFDPNGAAGSLGKNTGSAGSKYGGQANVGFFGGAQFDPNGAAGSLGKNTGSGNKKPQNVGQDPDCDSKNPTNFPGTGNPIGGIFGTGGGFYPGGFPGAFPGGNFYPGNELFPF